MAGEKRFTRIPPESTGDRVYMIHTAEIEFTDGGIGGSSPHTFVIGDRYDIQDFPGNFVHVHGVFDRQNGTGILAVHYNKTAKYENNVPETGKKIYIRGTTTEVGTVSEAYDVYIPAQNIMGYDNPEYGMDVDITGSANIRFAEGLPQLDAWGKLRVSGATHLGDYVFGQQEKIDDNFSTVGFDGGIIEWSADRKSARVRIDPSPTAPVVFDGAAAFAGLTSHTYHHYFPGSSHLYMSTVALNNPTQTGSTRRWGMFDADNGFFFMLGTGGTGATDNTGFCAVIRSNASAAIGDRGAKDLIIPRSTWNGDRLDGTGDSQETIDLSHDNIWWIDVQWHGAGRVRFGTYVNGQRVVCHSYFHGNRYEYAMTQSTSLPVCFSNKSTAATTQDLYIETWSASVWTETTKELIKTGKPSTYASNHATVTANISDNWQYLFSLSPKETIDTGIVNRTLYMPTSISAYAFDLQGGSGGTGLGGVDAIIDLKGEINSVHSGHDFSAVPSTQLDVSTAGTSYGSGKIVLQEMFRGRYAAELTDTYNNYQYGAIKNFSEDGGTKENTISAITNASPAEITISDPLLLLREPQTVNFPLNTNRYAGKVEILGSTNASFNGTYYLKVTGTTTAQLYTDEDLTVPFDSTSIGAFTGTALIKGFYGSRQIWSFFAKTRTDLHDDVKLMIAINWKEIIQ
jgi:hypothetical protein